jgi:DNA-binding CsgD family transcriptional regulator
MATDHTAPISGDDRLLETLQRLLAIQAPELRPALNQASDLVAQTLGAEKVDVLLYEAAKDSLVAMGTSDTPMGRRQHELGLDRVPIANGGAQVRVFQTGEPYLTGHADQDPEQPRGIVEGLGVRSQIDVPLDVGDARRGILSAMSTIPERFGERDLGFLAAVATWVGMLTHRAELVEQLAADSERRGGRRVAEELTKLTRRQQEVASCLAEGLTNEQIARRLVLTPGTVANHVEGILRRLALSSRSQVAVWAVERGLYSSAWRDDSDGTDGSDQRRQWRGRSVGRESDPDDAPDAFPRENRDE